MFESAKSNILPHSDLLKYLMLAAISFISGSLLFWLIISSSPAIKEQTNMNTASSFVTMESQDLHNISKSILSFKKTFGMDFNFKKNKTHTEEKINLRKITFPFIDKQKFVRYVIAFSFQLLDTDKNKLIDKTEWETFFSLFDKQYQTYYSSLFILINFGQPFNFQKYQEITEMAFHIGGIFVCKLTRKGELQLAEMIINDKSSYKNFQNMVFSIADSDHDNFITKNEIISLLVTFGLSAKKAETCAQQYLDHFSYITQRIDSKTISRGEFQNFFATLRKPLQEGLKAEKAVLLVHQMEMEFLQNKKKLN